MVEDFESVLNGFLYERNLDVYVTGSNSKFLSTDIITEFRGRGDEIKELNENETYTSWLTPEEDAEFILNTEKSISYEQGEKNRQIEIAKNLLKTDLKVEDISKATGFSIEELEKIKNNIDK